MSAPPIPAFPPLPGLPGLPDNGNAVPLVQPVQPIQPIQVSAAFKSGAASHGFQLLNSLPAPPKQITIAINGPGGSGKSHIAQMFPGINAYLAFRRGIDQIPGSRILYRDFAVNGRLTAMSAGDADKRWDEVHSAYDWALHAPEVKTITVDLGIDLWDTLRFHEHRRLKSVAPITFDTGNEIMAAWMSSAKAAGKNLVMLHHVKDKWRGVVDANGKSSQINTGEKEADWWRHTDSHMDIIVLVYIDERMLPVKQDISMPMMMPSMVPPSVPQIQRGFTMRILKGGIGESWKWIGKEFSYGELLQYGVAAATNCHDTPYARFGGNGGITPLAYPVPGVPAGMWGYELLWSITYPQYPVPDK